MGPNRKSAYRTFAKVLRLNSEGMIEARPVILPRDRGSEFYQIRFSEAFSHTRKQRVGDIHRSPSHAVGILQHEPLQFRKIEIAAIAAEIGDLFRRDAVSPAHGRADVNSKRAPNQRRYSKLGESLEFVIDQLAACL